MSARSHFRFGYAVQISSLLTLALVNIGLPNWIGTAQFARLNEAAAFVGFTCIIFNDGVALLVIRAIQRLGGGPREARAVAWQASFEHVLICLAALGLAMAATALISPSHAYRASDWLLIGVSGAAIAVYVCLVAWLTARLLNRVVAMLAIVQGLMSFALPVAAVAAGVDVRWAVAGCYLPGLVACVVMLQRTDATAWRPTLLRAERVAMVPSLPAASAQTAMRTAIVWFPVLVLAARQDPAMSVAYKIGLSLALGVCALVPYHRQTMLSLDGRSDAQAASRLAAGAVLLAAVGAMVLGLMARPVAALLYSNDLMAIGQLLPAFGSFVVLQVVSDVVLVRLLAQHDHNTLLFACGLAIASAATVAAFGPMPWLPAITLMVFLAAVLLRRGVLPELSLPLRAAVPGLLSAVASTWPASSLAGGGLALLVLVSALVLDGSLRSALASTYSQLLGGRH